MTVTNVLVAGVGGQGAVLASELIALAAMAAGKDVKQGEFHGVAQRGGSVFSHVRFGDRVYSPIAPRGAVDYLLSLEKLETLRYAHFVKPGGTVVINDHQIAPLKMADDRPYPEEVIEFLTKKRFVVVPVSATEKAIELGNHRAANVLLLGTLAEYVDIPFEVWDQTLEKRIPEKFLELNRKAFAAGRDFAKSGV